MTYGREERNARKRRWYAENREAAKEQSRRYRAANPGMVREYHRRYYEANREKRNEASRQYSREHPRVNRRRQERWEITTSLWSQQGELCYLCRKPILLEEAILEHDHGCCPEGKWCKNCIRGVAHPECNSAVGYAHDDPDLLERIARNLRAKLAEMDERMKSPIQDTLF